MKKKFYISIKERRELVEKYDGKITLDGEPAFICGICFDFPHVYSMKDQRGYAWAWATVKRICEKDGKFFSK